MRTPRDIQNHANQNRSQNSSNRSRVDGFSRTLRGGSGETVTGRIGSSRYGIGSRIRGHVIGRTGRGRGSFVGPVRNDNSSTNKVLGLIDPNGDKAINDDDFYRAYIDMRLAYKREREGTALDSDSQYDINGNRSVGGSDFLKFVEISKRLGVDYNSDTLRAMIKASDLIDVNGDNLMTAEEKDNALIEFIKVELGDSTVDVDFNMDGLSSDADRDLLLKLVNKDQAYYQELKDQYVQQRVDPAVITQNIEALMNDHPEYINLFHDAQVGDARDMVMIRRFLDGARDSKHIANGLPDDLLQDNGRPVTENIFEDVEPRLRDAFAANAYDVDGDGEISKQDIDFIEKYIKGIRGDDLVDPNVKAMPSPQELKEAFPDQWQDSTLMNLYINSLQDTLLQSYEGAGNPLTIVGDNASAGIIDQVISKFTLFTVANSFDIGPAHIGVFNMVDTFQRDNMIKNLEEEFDVEINLNDDKFTNFYTSIFDMRNRGLFDINNSATDANYAESNSYSATDFILLARAMDSTRYSNGDPTSKFVEDYLGDDITRGANLDTGFGMMQDAVVQYYEMNRYFKDFYDLDGDGNVNNTDVKLITRYLNGDRGADLIAGLGLDGINQSKLEFILDKGEEYGIYTPTLKADHRFTNDDQHASHGTIFNPDTVYLEQFVNGVTTGGLEVFGNQASADMVSKHEQVLSLLESRLEQVLLGGVENSVSIDGTLDGLIADIAQIYGDQAVVDESQYVYDPTQPPTTIQLDTYTGLTKLLHSSILDYQVYDTSGASDPLSEYPIRKLIEQVRSFGIDHKLEFSSNKADHERVRGLLIDKLAEVESGDEISMHSLLGNIADIYSNSEVTEQRQVFNDATGSWEIIDFKTYTGITKSYHNALDRGWDSEDSVSLDKFAILELLDRVDKVLNPVDFDIEISILPTTPKGYQDAIRALEERLEEIVMGGSNTSSIGRDQHIDGILGELAQAFGDRAITDQVTLSDDSTKVLDTYSGLTGEIHQRLMDKISDIRMPVSPELVKALIAEVEAQAGEEFSSNFTTNLDERMQEHGVIKELMENYINIIDSGSDPDGILPATVYDVLAKVAGIYGDKERIDTITISNNPTAPPVFKHIDTFEGLTSSLHKALIRNGFEFDKSINDNASNFNLDVGDQVPSKEALAIILQGVTNAMDLYNELHG